MFYINQSQQQPQTPMKAEKTHLITVHKNRRDRGLNTLLNLLLGIKR